MRLSTSPSKMTESVVIQKNINKHNLTEEKIIILHQSLTAIHKPCRHQVARQNKRLENSTVDALEEENRSPGRKTASSICPFTHRSGGLGISTEDQPKYFVLQTLPSLPSLPHQEQHESDPCYLSLGLSLLLGSQQ